MSLRPYNIFVALAAGLSLATTLPVEGRSSPNYKVLTDVVDAGGARSTSASYSHDGSVGGFGGTVTANAPQETVRVGYIGQLLEPVSLAINIPITNVNEATSQPLSATTFMDDGSVTTSADWRTLNGPIASINSSGLLTAANVYQDTPASIQGASEGLAQAIGLIVKNTGTDDFGLYGQDGIDDSWQVQFFGANNPAGTGSDVLFKYTAGLNPTNPASVFSVSLATAVAGQAQIRFSPRLTNRTYTVQYTTDLASGNYYALPSLAQNDNGDVRTVTDLSATNASRFYRVGITFP